MIGPGSRGSPVSKWGLRPPDTVLRDKAHSNPHTTARRKGPWAAIRGVSIPRIRLYPKCQVLSHPLLPHHLRDPGNRAEANVPNRANQANRAAVVEDFWWLRQRYAAAQQGYTLSRRIRSRAAHSYLFSIARRGPICQGLATSGASKRLRSKGVRRRGRWRAVRAR